MGTINQQDSSGAIARQKAQVARLAQGGEAMAALSICADLTRQIPDDPEVWFLMGAVNGLLPDYPEAERCCRKAVELAPGHAMLRFNLAVALLQQEKTTAAIEQFEHALRLQPVFADAWRELGNAQNMHNEPGKAIESYRKAIEIDPGSLPALLNLANTCLAENRLDDAQACFARARSMQADSVDAQSGYARVLIYKYMYEDAITSLQEALRHCPGSAGLMTLLGTVYQQHGDAAEAMKYYRQALDVDPGAADAQAGIAGMLVFQGQYDEAQRLLEPLLDVEPECVTARTTYATFARNFNAVDKGIKLAERELCDGNISNRTRTKYHFALGQLYDSKGQADKAFAQYKLGNEARDAHFDLDACRRSFDSIMEYFSAGKLECLPHAGMHATGLVFVVGMPRSGTSLAEQILASHPDVFGAGELHDISRLAASPGEHALQGHAFPHWLDKADTGMLDRLAAGYMDMLKRRAPAGARMFIDKMPTNFLFLGLISLLFPGARVVHCTRDPMDTCLSCYFKLFSGELSYAYSLEDLGQYYRLYSRLMEHWQAVLSIPVHVLNYETLVSDQENETRRLLKFCNLAWDDACLEFHKTDRTVSTASHSQVRQPMYRSSIGRWRDYEENLEPLVNALGSDT